MKDYRISSFADEPWITNIRLEHQSPAWPEKISLVIRPLKVAGAINSIAVGGIQLRSAKVLKDIFPRYNTTRWCFQNMCYTLNVWRRFLFQIESWYRHALWNQRDKQVIRYVDVEKLWRSRCVTCIAMTMGRHAVNSNPKTSEWEFVNGGELIHKTCVHNFKYDWWYLKYI